MRIYSRMAKVVSFCIGVGFALLLVLGPATAQYLESVLNPVGEYNLQGDLAFDNSTNALIFDVSATPQVSDCSHGVAYLLNGVTESESWFQVGIAWNWPSEGQGSFELVYEVFNPSGTPIFPSSGGAGLVPFSGPVQSGDSIRIVLAPANGTMQMNAYDSSTGSVAATSYPTSAQDFTGFGQVNIPGGSIFTGLMIECHRSSSGAAHLALAQFHDEGQTMEYAGLCITEWNPGMKSTAFPETCDGDHNLQESGNLSWQADNLDLIANSTTFIAGTQ